MIHHDKRTKVPGGWAHLHADGVRWAHTDETVCREGVRVDGESFVPNPDPVNLPPHYRVLPVECIDVTEHFSFCAGNAVKYLWRHQHKGNPIQDLEKAAWYIKREIERLKREQ